jgi:hypothetical protein
MEMVAASGAALRGFEVLGERPDPEPSTSGEQRAEGGSAAASRDALDVPPEPEPSISAEQRADGRLAGTSGASARALGSCDELHRGVEKDSLAAGVSERASGGGFCSRDSSTSSWDKGKAAKALEGTRIGGSCSRHARLSSRVGAVLKLGLGQAIADVLMAGFLEGSGSGGNSERGRSTQRSRDILQMYSEGLYGDSDRQ